MNDYKICKRCVSDTTISEIQFDSNGICNFCKIHDEMEIQYPIGKKGHKKLKQIITKIKEEGRGKKYDCIIGVSGGTDSSYMLYVCSRLGLKPLAVHYDNGWNSPIAVSNIKKLLEQLNIDLYTYVVNWAEFKDLQLSFLKASTSDAEIPTDVGIHGCLLRVASKFNLKYIMNGHSFRNESLMPKSWTYMDGLYISSVQNKFGSKKLKTFPNVTLSDFFYYSFIKGIKAVPILNYIKYDKTKAISVLEKKLDWKYSGGHHHESYYTEFFQTFLLPKKFNIDKRITELSGFIRTNQITRELAINELRDNEYPYRKELINYTLSKLDLSYSDFNKILEDKPRTYKNYDTYYPLIKLFQKPIKFGTKLGLLPYVLYQKFFN